MTSAPCRRRRRTRSMPVGPWRDARHHVSVASGDWGDRAAALREALELQPASFRGWPSGGPSQDLLLLKTRQSALRGHVDWVDWFRERRDDNFVSLAPGAVAQPMPVRFTHSCNHGLADEGSATFWPSSQPSSRLPSPRSPSTQPPSLMRPSLEPCGARPSANSIGLDRPNSSATPQELSAPGSLCDASVQAVLQPHEMFGQPWWDFYIEAAAKRLVSFVDLESAYILAVRRRAAEFATHGTLPEAAMSPAARGSHTMPVWPTRHHRLEELLQRMREANSKLNDPSTKCCPTGLEAMAFAGVADANIAARSPAADTPENSVHELLPPATAT